MLALAALLALAQPATPPAAPPAAPSSSPPAAQPLDPARPRLISYQCTRIGLDTFGVNGEFKADHNEVIAFGPEGSILGVARSTDGHRDVPTQRDKILAQAAWLFRDGKTIPLIPGDAQPGAAGWNVPVAMGAKGLIIGNTQSLAWAWENGHLTWLDLPGPQFQTPAGVRRSTAVGVSDSGTVVGQSPFDESIQGTIAWRWVGGNIEPLGLTAPPFDGEVLERCTSRALAITRAGLIVGSSGRPGKEPNRFGKRRPSDFVAWTFDGRDYKPLDPAGTPVVGAGTGLSHLVCSPGGRLAFNDSGLTVLVKDGGFETITVPGARPGSLKPLLVRDDGTVAGEAEIPLDSRRSLTALWVHQDGKTTRLGLTERGTTSNVFVQLGASPIIRGVSWMDPGRQVPWALWEGKTVKTLLNDADHRGSSGGHGDVVGISERGLVLGLSNRTAVREKGKKAEGVFNDPWILDLRTGAYTLLNHKPAAALKEWRSEPLALSPDGIAFIHHEARGEGSQLFHILEAWTAADGFRAVELVDAKAAKPLEIGAYGLQFLRLDEGAGRIVATMSLRLGNQFSRRELFVLDRVGGP